MQYAKTKILDQNRRAQEKSYGSAQLNREELPDQRLALSESSQAQDQI